MRCSSCELDLDRYLEGSLSSARMALVASHLAACASCQIVLEELRVVDALLATTRPAELPPNFTFAVLAEARDLKAPRQRAWRRPVLLGVTYLIAAWTLVLGTLPQLIAIANGPFGRATARAGQGIAGRLGHATTILSPQMLAYAACAVFLDAAIVYALVRHMRSLSFAQSLVPDDHP